MDFTVKVTLSADEPLLAAIDRLADAATATKPEPAKPRARKSKTEEAPEPTTSPETPVTAGDESSRSCQDAPTATPEPSVKEKQPEASALTLAQVRAEATQKAMEKTADGGNKHQQVVEVVRSFGVSNLPALDPEHFEAFLGKIRAL